ncbi:translation elongation factor Ts (EF-Ts) [Litorimonas taeanensis]|uniref:Elongation factor Ts n=1 Tax=Litorimonas taeanensis TaxID=568099 RepID=A0A420WL73_9PROT|nr:translation elongation factor Ts [Litorimonas taeanensis]RKQ71635.1 translation elongation factor Ts (EF-Ts) [Litorimonas taeanensis]
MAQITAAMVKSLRDQTSAGMMDCKKALNETNGDMEAAIDWLRTKGIAKADKKAGRVAAEGLVAVALAPKTGAVVEVNSETDFVARNEGFQTAVKEVAGLAVTVNSSEELAETKTSTGETVTEYFATLVGKIGENMTFRRMQRLSVENGVVAGYIHNAAAENMGKIGVLVALESTGDVAKLEELGKKIAMHIAATNPLSLTVDDLDQDLVAKERAALKAEALESGKPEAIVDKMVEGRMVKFFKESVLMTQIFVMDGERSIEQVIADEAKALGTDIKMTSYVRMGVGDGIEKKDEDFAAEVAAAVAGS